MSHSQNCGANKNSGAKKAVIIGAGPAGLTAAYELLEKSDIKPVIYESTNEIGGISKSLSYKGNWMDMGGHRFFSKSQRVMNWWLDILPLQGYPSKDDIILDRKLPYSKDKAAPDPEKTDKVMLVRNRLSRIFYLRRFFDYPVSLNWNTVRNLGFLRIVKIAFSYARARILPIGKEESLEDFMINRFGRELYLTFFKDYTQKVWGVSPAEMKSDWGAQRIKGLSVTKVLLHALKKAFKGKDGSIFQEKTEQSLIERFIFPKYGPGHLWEEVAERIKVKGGEIHFNHRITGLRCSQDKITEVIVAKNGSSAVEQVKADYFLSSMPVKDLIRSFGEAADENIRKLADGLVYRDFMTVGLLLKKLKVKNRSSYKTVGDIVPDLWVYIQERDVKIGRLQIFNNWSPYMVKDFTNTVWVGLEYFCNEGDELWSMKDAEFIDFAAGELAKIDIVERQDVLDGCVARVPKAYPSYMGTYDRFAEIRRFVDRFENLFLIGRNGMHRYNNTDHSMLTAMAVAGNIINGVSSKDNIWNINTEEEYHEEN